MLLNPDSQKFAVLVGSPAGSCEAVLVRHDEVCRLMGLSYCNYNEDLGAPCSRSGIKGPHALGVALSLLAPCIHPVPRMPAPDQAIRENRSITKNLVQIEFWARLNQQAQPT